MKAGRTVSMRLVAAGAAAAIAAMTVVPGSAAAEEARQLTVDATVVVGTLRPFSGVQAADPQGGAFYRAAHVDLVRIRDVAGVAVIDAIFPDKSADPEDAKAYRFAAADELVASVKSAGAEPLFDLYSAAGAAAGGGVTAPTDADKFAQVVRHVVLHYNAGWNKGFHHRIRYWEVWNAPDQEASWPGSAQDFYGLYERTANAIQAADDSALVGGPALSRPLIAGAWRERFFDFVRVKRLPFDFFTWHFFAVESNDPFVFVPIARQLRTTLDARGFGSTRSMLDEWGADPEDKDMLPAARAAFTASALIYMLGGPIDSQTELLASGDADPRGEVLKTFGSLKATPQIVHSTGADEAGFALIAARSADKRLVQVLISNYQVPAKYLSPRGDWDTSLPERRSLQYRDNGGYDAAITMPAAGKYRVKRFRIDASAKLALVDDSVQVGPNLHLQAALPPPAVEYIVISAK